MTIRRLGVAVFAVGAVLLIIGGLVAALKFLLWVGIVLAAVGALVWLFHAVTGTGKAT